MSKNFTVIGARRGVGLQCVLRLLEKDSAQVNKIVAVIRDASKPPLELQGITDARLEIKQGDCTNSESLVDCIRGSHIVLFCASSSSKKASDLIAVDEMGVKNVADISLAEKVDRVLLVSSQLVHKNNYWSFIRGMLNSVTTGFFKSSGNGMMDIKYRGEQLLRKSGQIYTICRPGRLVDGPLNNAQPRCGQNNASYMSSAQSTRADVAAVCISAALSPLCANVTFEMACEKKHKVAGTVNNIDPETLFNDLSSEWDAQWIAENN